jgi:hypothetical protein
LFGLILVLACLYMYKGAEVLSSNWASCSSGNFILELLLWQI